MIMEKLQYNIVVYGRVQGVWFRKYTKEKADELGVYGIVENFPDRTVFISAEGTKDQLEVFMDWLYEGSPLSRVQEIVWDTGEVYGYKDFAVKH